MEESKMALLEGVSNEALSLLIVIVIILVTLYMWTRAANSSHMIHPDQRAAVVEAREHRAANERNFLNRRSASTPNENENCPICLDQLTIAVETNCGHVFCGPCVMAYYETGSWLHGMTCPVCRQEVSLLLPTSTLTEEQRTDEARQTLSSIHAYNRRFSGEPRTLLENIQDAPVLFRHLMRELFSVHGLVFMFRARVLLYLLLAFIYIISPLDLIPEAVAGFLGLFDDIIILVVVLVYVTVLYRNYVASQ